MLDIVKGKLLTLIVITFCSTIMSLLLIHNGFPYLMADSIGYLNRAIKPIETSHWSNTYTVFLMYILRYFHSVQWIPIIQNISIVTVLYIFCRTYIRSFSYLVFSLIIFALTFTTLPWTSNLLMADIFTSITILSLILLLDAKIKKLDYLVLIPFAFLGISSHQSHLLSVPILVLTFILYKYIFVKDKKYSTIAINVILVSILIVSSNIFEKNILNRKVNKKEVNKKQIKPDISSGYYFVAVRIAESGELKHILDNFCDGTRINYICNGSDIYDPSRIKTAPPGTRHTGNSSYISYSQENKDIVMFALKEPRFYLGMLRLFIRRGLYSLSETRLPKDKRYNLKSRSKTINNTLQKVNSKDVEAFTNSKQINRSDTEITLNRKYTSIDRIWKFVIFPLLMFCLAFAYSRGGKKFRIDFLYIILFLILSHIVNTMICGTFSNYQNRRYSARTIWLVNLCIILVWVQVIQYITNKKNLKTK